MIKIVEIYNTFSQPPMLVLHQLRVAAVGSILVQKHQIKDENIVKALLVHDLGNIVRITFDLFKDISVFKPLGIEFYIKAQNNFKIKYGTIDHIATKSMLKEIGVNPQIIKYVEQINWENIEKIVQSNDMILKILNYADMRVSPFGIVSATERIDEVNRRKSSWPEYNLIREKVLLLEKQIFKNLTINPEDLNKLIDEGIFQSFLNLDV